MGFNNRGKTRGIYDLFNRTRFYFGTTYGIDSVNAAFTVFSASNDDFSESTFLRKLTERLNRAPARQRDFFGALCPTREPGNDSERILNNRSLASYDIHLLLLKNKWDLHAKLGTEQLEGYFWALRNVRIHVVDADSNVRGDAERRAARNHQVFSILQQIYDRE